MTNNFFRIIMSIELLFLFNSVIFCQANYEIQNSGTEENLHKVFFVNEHTGWILGDKGTLLSTTNSGKTWNSLQSDSDTLYSDIYFIGQNTGWIATYKKNDQTYLESTIQRTVDGGNTWQQIVCDTNIIKGITGIYFINDKTGWATESSHSIAGTIWNTMKDPSIPSVVRRKILKTADGGETWQVEMELEYKMKFEDGLFKFESPKFHDIYFIDEMTGWVTTCDNIFKTVDGGLNWNVEEQSLPKQIEPKHFRGIHFIDNKTGWLLSQGCISKTSDGGKQWNSQLDRASTIFTSVDFYNSEIGAVVGTSQYVTIDGGANWAALIPDTSFYLFDVFVVNENNAWAVGADGVIVKFSISNTTSVIDENNFSCRSVHQCLLQNYPNPFNPSTTIQYYLAKSDKVNLKIFNLLGQEIETLVDKFQAAGNYKITWQPGELPCGIYFYRIQTNNYSLTKKLIFQK